MKGLILAGGSGSRMRPLTYTSAKQLIPVANEPTIFYGIEAMVESGIKEIVIIVGDTAEEVKEVVGNGKRWGIKIHYVKQDAPLGLAHAVKIAKKHLLGSTFIMYLGDNILKDGVKEFVERFKKHKPNALILLTQVPNPEQFGVAKVDKHGQVLKLIEKPKKFVSDMALVGVYQFDKNIFKAIDNIKPSKRGELEITDAIQWLLDNKYKVESVEVTGWWKDTGKPSDILEANHLILETIDTKIEGKVDPSSDITGRIKIAKGAKIVNSVLRGPIAIGSNSIVENAYIGPFTSIGDNVGIINSEIESSIIMESAQIQNIKGRIDKSIIGKGAEVLSHDIKPQSHNFILGERSKIVIA